ncbi:3-polyprenyl-4-hydroxybenzoate decarboxylase [Lentisphaera araneosa HTCC2155]|uniref:3-polyprenyl-4-hydroxybenzoate decarboxylase n=1 Tax=Lentisphaera araneosa HTCC2155 TaxID=313628 RepID=A6DNS9_9BACT|nr:UbiD family decarboxylase [Lentisphaera araneosa]EDM26738.1 3-polyprenyl-4-hydroxybenzoate decarboxylase [Lentisphaera araneosa HTCC2155]
MYTSTKELVEGLDREGRLIRIKEEVDPNLEMAYIQRRVYERGGGAVLFEKVKGTPFACVSNLFASVEQTESIFQGRCATVKELLSYKADKEKVNALKKRPWKVFPLLKELIHTLPKKVKSAPVMECETKISDLPKIVCWEKDGGSFVTLPQVYSEEVEKPGPMNSNLGMYRIQLTGNDYKKDEEIGLHYQIHRGIGVHHEAHRKAKKPFRVAIFVGGPPSMTFSAVMPLPEGLPEVVFSGLLQGRRWRYSKYKDWTVAAEADFCILGTVDEDDLKPEGPFGDHLGYYSLTHNLPYMKIEKVFHRKDAIWPFTVVGRPPQEDTSFGDVIHHLTGEVLPSELPGLRELNAVDEAGVHPLLLATAEDRYLPYCDDGEPYELHTIAHAILGKGQLSLAKYLFLLGDGDEVAPHVHNYEKFFKYALERLDFSRDLHFHTCTTMDTLDYSSTELNKGSKLVAIACGNRKRTLSTTIPSDFKSPFEGQAHLVMDGVVALDIGKWQSREQAREEGERLSRELIAGEGIAMVILTEEAEFCAESISNFLWLTFTRSDPAADIYGLNSDVVDKHWACEAPMIIDARIKRHHAPVLEEDPDVAKRADEILGKYFK